MTTLTGSARYAARSDAMRGLARFGLAARGAIYLLLGWLVLLLARGERRDEADQRGAMQELARQRGGSILLWVLAVGLAGYALWRLSEAAYGVAGEGRKAGPRVQSFVRGCIYATFAISAFGLLLHSKGKSQARQQEEWTAKAMTHAWGRYAVAGLGIVVIVAGLVLVREGITKKFEKYLAMNRMSESTRQIVEVLGEVGTIARGVIFAISGVFVVWAAVTFDASKARGLDGTLRALAGTTGGPWLLRLVAVGLIAFGIYGFAEAMWRRTR
jgi:hypothetical protein